MKTRTRYTPTELRQFVVDDLLRDAAHAECLAAEMPAGPDRDRELAYAAECLALANRSDWTTDDFTYGRVR